MNKTTAVEKFLGLRNTTRPEEQPWGSLRDAYNVTLDDSNVLERRPGLRAVASVTNGTDLFCPIGHDGLFVVANGALLSYSDALVPSTVTSGLVDTAFAWDEIGDRVFYAGAVDAGIVVDRTHWQPLRVPVPDITVTTGAGSLYGAGQYQICATFVHDATGVEGPACPIEAVDLAMSGQIDVQAVPVAGYTARVYMTEADGGVLLGPDGAPLAFEQRDAQPLPTGITALTAKAGVVYAAIYDAASDVGFVLWSQPFWYTCWHLAIDYVAVPSKVLQMVEVEGGIIIITQHCLWFWDGDTLRALANYGGVPGMSAAQDRDDLTLFWTERGVCTYGEEGFKNLTQEQVSLPPGTSCMSGIGDFHGAKYLIVQTSGTASPANAYESISGSCWVMNARTNEVTRWVLPTIKGIGMLGSQTYVLTSSALLLLSGTADLAAVNGTETAISAYFTLHPTDFGDSALKRSTYVYVTGCDDSLLTVTPTTDEIEVGTFTGQRRIPLSRGPKGQYWQFKVSNGSGSDDFRLTGFEVLVEPTSRRVY